MSSNGVNLGDKYYQIISILNVPREIVSIFGLEENYYSFLKLVGIMDYTLYLSIFTPMGGNLSNYLSIY